MKHKLIIFSLITLACSSSIYTNNETLEKILGELRDVDNTLVTNERNEIFFKYPEKASGTITFDDPVTGIKTEQHTKHLMPLVKLDSHHKVMWVEMNIKGKTYNSGPIPVRNLAMYDLSKPESFLYFWTKCSGESEESGDLCCRTEAKPNPTKTISLETLGVLDKSMEKFNGLKFRILH